jgi:hypothetical protein
MLTYSKFRHSISLFPRVRKPDPCADPSFYLFIVGRQDRKGIRSSMPSTSNQKGNPNPRILTLAREQTTNGPLLYFTSVTEAQSEVRTKKACVKVVLRMLCLPS